MVRASKDLIRMGTGPYEINKANCFGMAELVHFRHYKKPELYLAKEFVRRGHLLGRYFFDVYLETTESKKVLPMTGFGGIGEAVPWLDRIDATCDSEDGLYILEFKDRLMKSGIGQLLYYKYAYAQQYNPDAKILLGYVVKYDNVDLHELLKEENIRLWVI